jgi:hypothetical protein
MKDSTVTAIATLTVTLFIAIPFSGYIVTLAWNNILVPLASFRIIEFWQGVQLSVAIGIASSLFNKN